MKNRAILFLFSILFGITQSLFARGADIAFQGLLNIGGAPANGSYDLTFQLFDAPTNGTPVAAPLTNGATLVSNGLFTVMLDFGDGVFAGSNYWVQIGARTNGGESFTNLSPLLPISPTPYAITAGTASNALVASALSGTVSNANLSGSYTSAVIFSNAANHFIGNGAGLTSLPISGSAVTTNSNPYGLVINLTTGAGNPSGGSSVLTNSTNTWTGTNLFTNTVIATNGQAANQFAGTFTGNGAGLSNVVAVALSGNYTNFTTNALNLTNAANLFAGTFAGNGAGLTNLPVATNVPTFTAGSGIIISTNAGSPTNYAISTTGGVQTNSTNVWTGTNTFSSAVIATNSPAANQFAGTFIGNGAGLTNVTAAAFSGTVSNGSIGGLYSNAVTLNNTNNVFAGDGSALVNLPNPTNVPTFTAGAGIIIATNAGSPTNYAISATGGVQTNDNNIWTGTNTFSNAVIATNGQASNQFAGTFIGNGAGLTNVTAVALSGTYTNFTTNALTITNPANVFAGNGSGLTNITAAVFSGTLSNASLSGLYTNALTFSNSSNVFIGNGTGLTNVTAAFFSGTLSNANFGGLYSNAVTFSNANNVFAGDGSGLTNLPMPTNAPTFTAGSGIVIVTNAGSPTNYAISSTSGVQTNYTNVWTGTNTFTNAVVATNNQFANRFAGTFTGNGVGLTNISASVIKGALPSGNITGVYTNAVTFIYTGDVFGGTFAGNGAGVTNLPITGSAVTTNASPYGLVISSVSGVQPNFTNTWTGTNLFTNTVIATNGQPANKFAGTFIGNGAGLTNVTAAIFTGTVSNASIGGVYTNAVTFSNSGNVFTGNGAGLTGVVAASVSSNFNFSTPNAVMLTNSGNTFAGNGAGLSNLDASQLTGGPWTNATMAGITNFGAYFASNPVTAASFLVTTNGHVITVDEHGDTNKTGTNGLFGSFMANGNFAYASNGNFQVSGNSTVGANFFVSNNASVGGNLAVNGLIYGSGAGLTNIAGTTPRQTISGTNAAALPNESYFLTNEGQSLVTLPTTANVGDVVTVTGVGTNGWEVASGAGQNIAGYFQTVGANWVPQNSGIQSWLCVASSADGSKLVAAGSFTSIYTSTNSGTNWTAQNSSNLYWLSVASSADGTRLVAAPNYDQKFDAVPLYTSSDSGMTWTAQTNAPDAYWESVASSADGTKLVAVENFDQDYNPGLIYTSTNSGTNWTAQNSGTLNWSSVASSADGSKLAATAFYDQNGNFPAIYTSSDSGVTWTAQTNAPDAYWQGIASSADGSKLVAVATYDPGYNPTPIYTSTNSGTNWTAQNSGNQYWYSVASSSDGTMLAAAFQGGPIYGSSDSGVTWTALNSGSRTWYEVASSADGTKLAAVVNNGAIYTSDQIYFPFVGAAGTTAEFQYSGDGVWQALSTPASQINGTIALANLPGAVVTNGASGIDVSGMFSGDGSGLTNLNPNVALLSANQAFTGSNAFNQSVVIANGGSLQLIGNGGGGATAKVDLSTYNTGTNPPTTRIQATDDGNAGNSFDIYTKADGNQANGLVSRLHVSPNGNVGIGTTSPGTALAVNGNVSASNFSGTFTGNLTGNLTGNATTATTATTAATAAVASNVVFGINITNAVITGSSFSGNGAGLTNVTTSWQTVPGIEATAAANEAYLLTNNTENLLTLPATTNVGAIVTVSGVGSNGWQVLPNAGQTIAGYGAIVPAGTTWTDQVTSPIYWNHVASSSDGTRLVVVGDSGIYTSVNSGTNWTFQTNTSPECNYIASSADGTKLLAAAYGNGQYEGSQIYTSTNSGTNWTAQNGAPITNWTSLASSADGTKLAATDFITEGNGGGLYTSLDSGVTWTAQTNAPSLYFAIVASSADGTKLVLGGYDTPVYISTDSGTNWIEPSNSPVAIWESFASSADGTALVGGDYYGDIYTSKDSGVTWAKQYTTGVDLESIASSSDGSRLVAVGYTYNGGYIGRIYTSINSGTNWTEQLNGSQSWTGAASSADGTKLVAVAYGGIYTSDQTGTPFGGSAGTTAQFQYVGNGVWQPLSSPASQIAGVLSPAQLPAGVLTNTQAGVTLSGTFGGNGGALTNLNASQLYSGTISLALLPAQVVTNTETNVNLSGTFIGNLAGNAAMASNVVSGISITNAFITNAVITNSTFAGNGSGLTNLNASNLVSGSVPLAQLPPQVVTNAESNVTLSGTFFGNLAGNATTASNVVSGISITNAFVANAIITNSTFSGNGTGLTNLNASQLASGTISNSLLSSNVVISSSSPVPVLTNVYSTTGTNTLTIPPGVTQIIVKLWGAGGGGSQGVNPGGGGAFVQKTLSVVPGQTYLIVTGQRGDYTNSDLGGVGSGDASGGAIGLGYGGSQGGQASSLFYFTGSQYIAKAVAGAGGGGGYTGAGGAGGNPGQQGFTFDSGPLAGGLGGNNGIGGAGGAGVNGFAGGAGANYSSTATNSGIASLSSAGGNGGSDNSGGGGGGGGGYGGGGGGGYDEFGYPAGGGGGGSFGDIIIAGSGSTAGNSADPNYVSPNGKGGSANSGAAGGDGLAVVILEAPTASIPGWLVAGGMNGTLNGSLIGNATSATTAGTASVASNLVSGTTITNVVISNSIFAGNGAGLTNLSASQLVTGSIADSVLPANVVTIGGSPCLTNVYSSAGTNNVVVPAGVTLVIAKLWGAGGGGGNSAPGGGGAFVQKTLSVVPGQTLTVVVGQRGDISAADLGGVNSSNAQGGSPGYLGDYNERGQGGQASSLFYLTNGSYIMEAVAGAGGGGGLYGFAAPGGAGGNPGAAGTAGGNSVAGAGGYNGIGGAAGGTGNAGSNYATNATTTGVSSLSLADGDGGNGANWSGGGGGGYGGGGGGGSGSGGAGAGGGGGGSYGDIVISGNSSSPGNTADPNYAGPNGTGGTAVNGAAGNDGLVVLIFETPAASVSGAVVATSFSGPLNGNATTATMASTVVSNISITNAFLTNATITNSTIGGVFIGSLEGPASIASNLIPNILISNVTITNSSFAGNGTNLTNLNASNLAGGMVPFAALAALPSGTNNTWTGTNTFTNGLYASNAVTGGPGANSTMTLNGKTYEGYFGIGNHFWTGLTNGVAWFETSNHYLWQTNFTTSAAGANIVYSNSFFSGNSGTVRLDFNATAGCPTNGSATVSLSRNYQYVYYGASGATPTEANTTTLSLPAGTTLATAQAVGAGYFYLTCSGVAITNVDWEVEIEVRQKH